MGQHELELMPHESHKCNTKLIQRVQNIELKVNIPEGLIWAINRTNPDVKLWQYKVESPIVSVWREHGDQNEKADGENMTRLTALNLFESTLRNWGDEYTVSPDIYVGMHDRQLYIQENIKRVQAVGGKLCVSFLYRKVD